MWILKIKGKRNKEKGKEKEVCWAGFTCARPKPNPTSLLCWSHLQSSPRAHSPLAASRVPLATHSRGSSLVGGPRTSAPFPSLAQLVTISPMRARRSRRRANRADFFLALHYKSTFPGTRISPVTIPRNQGGKPDPPALVRARARNHAAPPR